MTKSDNTGLIMTQFGIIIFLLAVIVYSGYSMSQELNGAYEDWQERYSSLNNDYEGGCERCILYTMGQRKIGPLGIHSENYYCVWKKGLTDEQIASTDIHEKCHALVMADYEHFCEGKGNLVLRWNIEEG